MTEKHTPKLDHFINDGLFAQTLAKRHLLGHSFKESLPREAVLLFRVIAQAGSVSTRFGFNDPSTDPAFRDRLQHTNLTYLAAKKAVGVTAAVHIACTMSGQEQALEARAFVDKRGESLPKALLGILTEKAESAGASKLQTAAKQAKT